MRKSLLLTLSVLLSAPALAWVPKLEETTAKNVIDGAYGRRDLAPTYLTVDLGVKDGQFVSGPESVKVFDGGAQCVTDWLAAPGDFSRGSRVASVTASGQADQLYFQATDARDSFKNLSAADALGADLSQARLADGELRVDLAVRGLPSEKARDAYLVRMRGADGKMVTPVRRSYVNDFKQGEDGKWSGTLVYYFKPLDAGVGASDRVDLLLRTEADTNCAYSVGLNLASFQ
ncbi:hypothetical protein [Deinococcus wulumuqiensis]|uniref:DUF2259 domain-containing protein n=1 Tax=Deinococcus wulumuqiensis TaxID=980427 RepID=A0AAV4K6T1_9DEIO|nr:hypothetical protein [Deinococcus wulumuqiensis]QII20938.1 hypothetical protein G6R31_09360 [Deinococcus wulumuqiensis R12]GGI79281.1 hypothetical protein GCM10010914_11800 [Deinococcus wulumuqiensis]GGP28935.1 hypothetical protein GCM10008021_05860 [Deinococcus wulumuqiensis]